MSSLKELSKEELANYRTVKEKLNKLNDCLTKLRDKRNINPVVALGLNLDDMFINLICSVEFPVDVDYIENIFKNDYKVKYMQSEDFESNRDILQGVLNFSIVDISSEINVESINILLHNAAAERELESKFDIW